MAAIEDEPRPGFLFFQTCCRNEVLRRVLMDVANELRGKGALDEAECFIDATFVMAKGGGAEIGPTKRGKGMKIMAIVDRHGLPLSISIQDPAAPRDHAKATSSLTRRRARPSFRTSSRSFGNRSRTGANAGVGRHWVDDSS